MPSNKQDRQLAHFYKTVAGLILKSESRRVRLVELESVFKRNSDACFSWMQWPEAKQFFQTCHSPEPGTAYCLRRELQGCKLGELIREINKYFNLYQE